MRGMVSETEDQDQLLEEVFKIQGRDKRGRNIFTIVAKYFHGGGLSVEVMKKHLSEKIYPRLERAGPFSILYVHTHVDTLPVISALRCVYHEIPPSIKINLQTLYFLHPPLHSRLFLATFGRLFFSGGLYRKVKYVSRVDYLWEDVRRNEIELPEFVYDHDEKLEYRRPMMDYYGLESDHPRFSVDSPVPMYSMRCIS